MQKWGDEVEGEADPASGCHVGTTAKVASSPRGVCQDTGESGGPTSMGACSATSATPLILRSASPSSAPP